MDVRGAISDASAESGIGFTQMSRAIGRSRQFVHTIMKQSCSLTFDNAAMMFAACGYTLCAVKGEPPNGALAIDTSVKGATYAELLDEIRLMREAE